MELRKDTNGTRHSLKKIYFRFWLLAVYYYGLSDLEKMQSALDPIRKKCFRFWVQYYCMELRENTSSARPSTKNIYI